jgi:hypothetical protein
MATENYPTYPDLARSPWSPAGRGGSEQPLLTQNSAKVTVKDRDEAAIDSVLAA